MIGFRGARRPRIVIAVAAALGFALVAPAGVAQADASGPGDVSAYPFLDPSLYTGATPDTAAASCWEVKQLHPDSVSGIYWLLTPTMEAPQQFWCDQETDGGGWVKVGAGRNAWEPLAAGRGNPATLLQPTPAANTQTTELSAETIDGLLDGAPVSSLADGIRVRRAHDTDGTTWQEVRFKVVKPVGWFWTFGAGWPVASYDVGGTTGTGGTTASFGSNSWRNPDRLVDTSISDQHQYTWGFSYGSRVTGLSADTSYLWTPTDGQGGARPFAEVYIRPQIINPETSFARIGNSGTPKIEKEVVPESDALVNSWGVTGVAGAFDGEGDVEVQAMARIGSTMYVGGNFATVQQNASGAGAVDQPFLAAFNADTGAFISSFRPTFNEAVQALTALPDGRLAVGGKFTQVNGTAVTGLVVLNASTGAVTSGWNTTLVNNVSPGLVRILVLTTDSTYLYVGGTFTHTTGPNGRPSYARNAMRLRLSDFNPDTNWRPEFNGSVQDTEISEDDTKAYYAGFFDAVSGTPADSAAALLTSTPAQTDPTPWVPVWSADKSYQQGIEQVGNRIYSGGSEHNLFSFDTTTYERLTTQINNPKGDTQVVVADDENTFLWAGSHSNNFTYMGADQWPNVGTSWTRADTISWIGAWRLSDVSYVSTFTPSIRSRLGSGAWAVAEAPNGDIWVGGDFEEARVTGNVSRWTGAFVRFTKTDGTAPNTPSNLRVVSQGADTVTLAWNAPSGGVGSGGSYQILRDDRTIATTSATSITVPTGGENRFFVRAADATGNVSASTAVLTVPGGNPSPVASIAHTLTGLDASFDGSGSTDNSAIAAYYWSFGDGETSNEVSPAHHYAHGGSYPVSLVVVDDQGAWTRAELTLDVVQPAPTDAYGLSVYNDSPEFFWRLDETSGTTAIDYATGPGLGNIEGGVTLGASDALVGYDGHAATFDGSSGQVISTTAEPGPTVYSAEAWFSTTTTRGGKIIGFGNAATGTSSNYDRHVFMTNTGQLVFGVYTGSENRVTTTASYNDGLWHQVVATQSADGMKLYVDGELVGTNPQTDALAYTGYWRIGGDRVWSGASSSFLAGRIDEAAVYDHALTADQVQEHYALGMAQAYPEAAAPTDTYAQTVLADSPAEYWRLDGAQEQVGADTAPGYDLTQASGGVTFDAVSAADGGPGSAVFNGTDGVVAQRTPHDGPSTYATELWFSTTTTTGGKLIGFGDEPTGLSGSYDRHVFMTDTGQLVFGVYNGSIVTVTTAASYNDGQWHHLVAQQGPAGMELYVDGVLVGSDPTTTQQAYAGYWRIGGDQVWTGATSPYFAGRIGEVAIYDAPLTSAQVVAHYIAGEQLPPTPPTAAFTPTTTYLTVDVDATASADPDGTITSYAWNFGDGTSGTGVTASHTYAAAGDYTVTLTVTDNDGATDTTSQTVTATEPPNVAPTAAFTSSAVALAVSFDGTTSSDPDGTVASYAWDFGDGTTGTGATPSHTYAAAGDYSVALTVTDNEGATGTTTQTVSVSANQPPTAAFTATPSGLSVAFDGTTSSDPDGTIASYAWDFGDSELGSGATPSHSYGAPGTYTVVLTVTDDLGASATTSQQVTVVNPNQAPTASFTSAVTDLTVNLDATGSSDPDGTVVDWAWSFGDGDSATGETTSHTYAAAGTYTVVLTVTDDGGASGVSTALVTVTEPANQPPTASFTSSVTDLTVSLDGTGSSDPDGTVASYAWDFGDGATGTGATTSHTYAAAGSYTVGLTVTDDKGATASTSAVVIATDPAGVPVTTTPVAMDDTWSWYYEQTAPPATWNQLGFDASGWATGGARLGWGSPSIVTNIDHYASTTDRPRAAYFVKTFDVPNAAKVVSLTLDTVADDGVVVYVNGVEVGRHNMRDGDVTFYTYAPSARNTATADADPVVIEVPTDLLVNGTNVIAAETHVNYRATRDVSYRLEATLVTDTATGTINNAPTADISASITGYDLSVDGSGSSDSDGTVASYAWDFGDGSTATGATATHSYAAAGDYTVSLTVTDDKGATDTATTTVTAVDPSAPTESTPVAMDASWSWRYEAGAPPTGWNQPGFDASAWSTGGARLGFGSPLIVTNVDTFATTTDRPRAAYWIHTFDVTDASAVVQLTLNTVADDGVVVYVNGVEVGRHNMPTSDITYLTYAPSARNITTADADPVVIDVPASLLVDGTNVIAAETHVNYRATRDMSFRLEATMLAN